MQITIVGGSGGTGAELARQAIAAGHEVTVVSRSGTGPDGADVVQGDANDADVARRAVAGADVVVITVGGARGVRRQRAAVTRSVVAAMRSAGVRRVLVQSSLGAGDSAAQMPTVMRWLMRLALASALADHEEQEAAVRESGLDWTIVRPTGLTDKPGTGRWLALEVSDGGYLGATIPRADLAAFLLTLLTDPATAGRAYGVSGPLRAS
ncbi:MAG: NAD(P)H-binding protein [Actinomycetales bacterium]|nr:NAD(P)H-binding protein [Actinomycetales bacterium]